MSAEITKSTVAAIIVTFKRQELLKLLLNSFADVGEEPDAYIIVDNERSEETAELVERFMATTTKRVIYAPQEHNGGGAGGFHAGAKIAYDNGFDWIWLMDDDVAVVPGALQRLRFWMDRTDHDLQNGVPFDQTSGAIQGQRIAEDGTLFSWQHRMLPRLAIPNPAKVISAPAVTTSGPIDADIPITSSHYCRQMSLLTFEGCIFRRELIEKIGLPDSRYFIALDDTTYGYLASLVTKPIETNDLVLRRTKPLQYLDLPMGRKLSNSSDLAHYYLVRNRGYLGNYIRHAGVLNKGGFAIGTLLALGVEVTRLAMSNDRLTGAKDIIRGLMDCFKVMHEKDWEPTSLL